MNKVVDSVIKAFYIAKKDAKVYYFKAPNFTYGLLIPVSLYLAFSVAGNISTTLIVAGLTSLVMLFGITSIEAVAVVLEKQTGTLDRLLLWPNTRRSRAFSSICNFWRSYSKPAISRDCHCLHFYGFLSSWHSSFGLCQMGSRSTDDFQLSEVPDGFSLWHFHSLGNVPFSIAGSSPFPSPHVFGGSFEKQHR